MNDDQTDPRTAALGIAWMAETGGKTRAAIGDLLALLLKIGEDLKVEDDEILQLIQWKIAHRHVLSRPAIRPFAEWLDRILADGEVGSEEKLDLLGWCHWAKTYAGQLAQAFDGADVGHVPPPPRPSSPRGVSWRSDPATARQLSFLEDLGADPATFDGLTKGAASAMIDRLLAKRDEAAARHFADLVRAELAPAPASARGTTGTTNTMRGSLSLDDLLDHQSRPPVKPAEVVQVHALPPVPKESPRPRHRDPKAVYFERHHDPGGVPLTTWVLGVLAIVGVLLMIGACVGGNRPTP